MKIVYQNPWFQVQQHGQWHFVHEPAAVNGAVVVAQQDERFVLVRVPRPAVGARASLEFPRGYGSPGESALTCAARELHEETGFAVAPQQFALLGSIRPNTAILTSTLQVFRCTIPSDCVAGPRDNEASDVVLLSAAELRAAIAAGHLTCGITLAALLHAQL